MGIIKLPKKSISFFEENIKEIFESGALAEGSWNKKAGEHVCKYTGSKYAVVTNSNGAGILATLQLLSEYYGSNKVLLQSNTMYGMKTMVNSSGLNLAGTIPCSLPSLMPTIDQIKASVSAFGLVKNDVILLSHIGGIVNPAIVEIVKYCDHNGLLLVEDCAHSYGATLNNKHSGTYGIAGIYSYYSTKAIPVGEGGVVVTNDSNLYDKLDRYSKYDRFKQEMRIGFNIRMSEMQALMLYSVLIETESIILNKQKTAHQYIKICDNKGIEYLEQENEVTRGNYYKFIIISRSESVEKLYPSLQSLTSKVYDYTLGLKKDSLSDNHLCLPIWFNLDQAIIEKTLLELDVINTMN